MKGLLAAVMESEVYDADLFKETVKVIYVKDKGTLDIYFADGTIKSAEYIPPLRFLRRGVKIQSTYEQRS